MQRLVYSPSIKVWVKADSGVVDLSPYVTQCNVRRVIDDVSSAEVEFRNPKTLQNGKPRFLFTERVEGNKVLPVFHPMDPIVITLERIAGRPIQVFTGYCDTVPDVQLFPGVAKIKASCTLKRLLHTYWDPALPFVQDFMFEYGWNLDKSNGQVGTTEVGQTQISETVPFNDSGFGTLLYAVLNEIGGWDNSNIYIQPLPEKLTDMVANIFDEIVKDNEDVNKQATRFVKDIIGAGEFGSAVVGNDTSNGIDTGNLNSGDRAPEWIEKLIADASRKYGVDANLIRAQMRAESSFDPNATGAPNIVGLMQLHKLYVYEQTGYTAEEVSTDNRKNVYAGVAEMKTYLKNHNGNIPLALADYNAGPTGAKQRYAETVNYVKKICAELGISTSPYV